MPTTPQRSSLLAGAALIAAWALLHAPVIGWLGARFGGSPLHAGVLLVTTIFLLRDVRPSDVIAALSRPPRAAKTPIVLVAGSALALAACERRLGTTTLSAVFAGLGAYGLAGLWLDAHRFRRALPAALLLTALLPFGEQADTYFGFAARAFSARVVAALLVATGHAAVPVETLLLLENGVAHVDVPCSGARSLWTGLLFFLAASCVLGRRPGARWILAGLVHLSLLVGENVVRVAAVVLLAVALELPRVAEILHAPFGVLGFALACGLTLVLLRRFVPEHAPAQGGGDLHDGQPASRRVLAPALAAALLALTLLRAPRAAHASPPPVHLDLGADVASEPLPLDVAEADLFRRWGGSADKRRFRSGTLGGSLLAVFSRSFRAHHPPEICLASSGVRLDGLHAVSLGGGATVRVAAADGGRRTVVYWFQSPTRTTGDLSARIWDEISGRERRWVQISLVVDAPLDVDAPEGRALVAAVRNAAARVLSEETP